MTLLPTTAPSSPIALTLALLACSLPSLSPAEEPKNPAVDQIVADYTAIEESLPTAREIFIDIPGESWSIQLTAWTDKNNRLVKLREFALDDYGSYDREYSFREDGSLLFLWEHTEKTPLEENAPTTAAELRLYFSEKKLELALRKEATFAPDASREMDKVQNSPVPADEALALVGGFEEVQNKIADYTRRLDALEKPAFTRTIEGTTSPDGKFAFAWAPDSGKAEDVTAEGQAVNEGQTHNYLVQLEPRKVLALTDGLHFADQSEVARISAHAHWSPNSQWVLEVTQNKWGVMTASLWAIQGGEFPTNPVNVIRDFSAALLDEMKRTGHPAAKHLADGNPFAPTFSNLTLTDEGVLSFNVEAFIPHGDPDDDSGTYSAKITLTPAFEDSGFMISNRIDVTLAE